MSTQVKPGTVPVKANERPKYGPTTRGGGPMGHGAAPARRPRASARPCDGCSATCVPRS